MVPPHCPDLLNTKKGIVVGEGEVEKGDSRRLKRRKREEGTLEFESNSALTSDRIVQKVRSSFTLSISS